MTSRIGPISVPAVKRCLLPSWVSGRRQHDRAKTRRPFISSNMAVMFSGPKAGTRVRCATPQSSSSVCPVKSPLFTPCRNCSSGPPTFLSKRFSSHNSFNSAWVEIKIRFFPNMVSEKISPSYDQHTSPRILDGTHTILTSQMP